MVSGFLETIIGISFILNGGTTHFDGGKYQERNQIKGVEISTNIAAPFSENSETSFYYKELINSFDQKSATIGSNVKLIKIKKGPIRLDLGYTIGLIKGYTPPVIYQDGDNEIKAVIAPYLLGWAHFAIQPIKDIPLLIGADFNCALPACGWQSKITLETKF